VKRNANQAGGDPRIGNAGCFCGGIRQAGSRGGTISGKVTYEGTPARMKPIDMSKETAPLCD
jgi:hypothetical protein